MLETHSSADTPGCQWMVSDIDTQFGGHPWILSDMEGETERAKSESNQKEKGRKSKIKRVDTLQMGAEVGKTHVKEKNK